jgi:hypothetical protein
MGWLVVADFRDWQILLQKSKIERPRKSRESRFLNASTAATLCSEDTKVGGRFCVKRCGPSHRRAQNAPAAPENFVHQPKKTFSTVSARLRHPAMSVLRSLSGEKRTYRGQPISVSIDPKVTFTRFYQSPRRAQKSPGRCRGFGEISRSVAHNDRIGLCAKVA